MDTPLKELVGKISNLELKTPAKEETIVNQVVNPLPKIEETLEEFKLQDGAIGDLTKTSTKTTQMIHIKLVKSPDPSSTQDKPSPVTKDKPSQSKQDKPSQSTKINPLNPHQINQNLLRLSCSNKAKRKKKVRRDVTERIRHAQRSIVTE